MFLKLTFDHFVGEDERKQARKIYEQSLLKAYDCNKNKFFSLTKEKGKNISFGGERKIIYINSVEKIK